MSGKHSFYSIYFCNCSVRIFVYFDPWGKKKKFIDSIQTRIHARSSNGTIDNINLIKESRWISIEYDATNTRRRTRAYKKREKQILDCNLSRM